MSLCLIIQVYYDQNYHDTVKKNKNKFIRLNSKNFINLFTQFAQYVYTNIAQFTTFKNYAEKKGIFCIC